VFARAPGAPVFTPASAASAQGQGQGQGQGKPLGDVFSAPGGAGSASKPLAAFTPFADTQTPFKVFVRPGGGAQTAATPTPAGAFKPLRHRQDGADENAAMQVVLVPEAQEDPPTVTITQELTYPPGLGAIREAEEEAEGEGEEDAHAEAGSFTKDRDTDTTESETDGSQDQQHHVEYGSQDEAETTEEDSMMEDHAAEQDESQYVEAPSDQGYETPETPEMLGAEYEAEDGRHAVMQPLGRFGAFTVMTPVMERTFEFTASSYPAGTPLGHVGGRVLDDLDEETSADAPDLLTSELRDPTRSNALRLSDVSHDDESGGHGDRSHASVGEGEGEDAPHGSMSFSTRSVGPEPCDPFEPQRLATLMSLIPAVPGYHDYRRDDAELLDGLQKFAKKLDRSGGAALAAPYFRFEMAGRRFGVYEKLGEGGFGAVFAAKDLTDMPVDEDMEEDEDEDEDDEAPKFALKVVKPPNIWEYHVLHRLHAALPDHLRQSVITPHELYAFNDESFFVMDLCSQGTLLDMVNRAGETGISRQGACMDELLVFFFTIELMRLLEAMHHAGFIHGDLKIDNCLIRLDPVPDGDSNLSNTYHPGADGWQHKGIKLIDFGRTIDTRLFPADQTFVNDWKTDARDCREMREGRPWTFQPDYHGLADIIYCMLFGKYMDDSSLSKASNGERVELATPLKRYWQADLWSRVFDLLLNPSFSGTLPLCDELATVREEMEQWLEANSNRTGGTLKSLLKRIERACV
jgi:checkpoint serine/threonine-protein kinase